jgi:putative hydrolase of the HAD superfamily
MAAGVPSEAVLHIGDDAALDVLGALSAGMHTVWVNREAQPWAHEAQPHLSVASLHELCNLLAGVPENLRG